MAKKSTKPSNPNLKNNVYSSDAGVIISRKNHPVTLSYGGEALIVPPRGRVKIENKKMLGAIPKGVFVGKI